MPNAARSAALTLDATPVLVVDDQALSRELLAEALRLLGCKVTQAGGGADALRHMGATFFPLVFVDLMMPEMDGYALVSHIRQNVKGHDAPTIIAYSGTLYAEDNAIVSLEKTRLSERGFDDGLAKPLTLEALRKVIDTAFPEGIPTTDQPAAPTAVAGTVLVTSPAVVKPTAAWKVAESYNTAKPKSTFATALVVDDDRFMLMTTEAQLKRHTSHVDTASTAEEAFRLFCAQPYDLILMDLEMPDVDGLTLAQKLRVLESAATHRTCIVALSGHLAGQDILKKCAASGMDDCLAKPLDPVKFKERLELWQKGVYPASALLKK